MTYVVAGVSRTSSPCANIGPAERRKRVRVGIASFALAIVVASALIALGAARGWRLLALPPIWIGSLGLVQAMTRTCVALAARGVRNMDAGDEHVNDPDERQALMTRAIGVHVWTLILTLVLTAALLAIP